MTLELLLPVLLLAATGGVVAYAVWRGRRESAVFQEMDRMADRLEELTLRVVGLELNQSGYRVWTSQLRGQVLELGGTPVPPPAWLVVTEPKRDEPEAVNLLVAVYHLISEHFSVEEMADLAFQAGIDTESFGGETKAARARQLVEVAYRNDKLPPLVREARALRPAADWPAAGAVARYQSSTKKE